MAGVFYGRGNRRFARNRCMIVTSIHHSVRNPPTGRFTRQDDFRNQNQSAEGGEKNNNWEMSGNSNGPAAVGNFSGSTQTPYFSRRPNRFMRRPSFRRPFMPSWRGRG